MARTKTLLIGADGQLGSDIARCLEPRHDLVPLTIRDLDITDGAATERCLRQNRPEVVINTAGFHNVPLCEEEPLKAYAVNAVAVRGLAIHSRNAGARLLHVSTDFVFDGRRSGPYVEEDAAWPVNVYGASKLAGECGIRAEADRYWIVRTAGLFGRNPCLAKQGANFVRTMLRLGREREVVRVVDDERLTPTSTADLAAQIARLVETDTSGTFHASAEGACTWFEFTREIFRLAGIATPVEPITAAQFGDNVRRPKNSVLENRALKELGLNVMRPWQEGLRDYLEEIGELRA